MFALAAVVSPDQLLLSQTKKDNKNQPSIRTFFAPTKTADSSAATEPFNNEADSEYSPEALPVTAYGVWVSEIMLQQTRVEAVIPFYLKCMLIRLQPQ